MSLYLFSSTKKKTTRVDTDTSPKKIARLLNLKSSTKLFVSTLLYLNIRKRIERIITIMLVFSHSFFLLSSVYLVIFIKTIFFYDRNYFVGIVGICCIAAFFYVASCFFIILGSFYLFIPLGC